MISFFNHKDEDTYVGTENDHERISSFISPWLKYVILGGIFLTALLFSQAAWAQDPAGYTRCADEGETFTLPAKSHVAYGANGYYIYKFNQSGVVTFDTTNFGSDPVYGAHKSGYYKLADGSESSAALSAAMNKISAHLNGATRLTATQINEQTEIIKSNLFLITDNDTVLTTAFALVDYYEANKGPIFINSATKGGFPNAPGATDGFEAVRAVFMVQQGLHDYAFTPENVNKFQRRLNGRKFLTSRHFPGAVAKPTYAGKTYIAKINASVPKDIGLRTAFSRSPARRPTGYYLAPGNIGTVSVPASMINKGFTILVGAHTVDKTGSTPVRRFFRVTNSFPITSASTRIANPFGGGIYLVAPYLADLGIIDVKLENVVPAPFFSATSFQKTTLREWKDVQRKNPAPWADFVTDKFMMQVPSSWIYNHDDPVTLMQDWDRRMDGVSELIGKPLVRNNYILYVQIDTDIMFGAYGIGYPQVNNTYEPGAKTNGKETHWFLKSGADFSATEFHELGHAQLFSGFDGEGEAAVNVPAAYIWNVKYGMDLDLAFGKSFDFPQMSRDQAAIAWMVTPNFRAGNPMDISNTTHDEVRYQHRGYAKYIEIAGLFGWSKLGDFYKQENLDYPDGAPDDDPHGTPEDGLTRKDNRIFRMSKAAGVDLRPLIHFWGVHPDDNNLLKEKLTASGLSPSGKIRDRLLHYKSIIPMNKAQFTAHARILYPNEITIGESPDYGEGWYHVWLPKYNNSHGLAAQAAIQDIINLYFPASDAGKNKSK